MAKVEKCVFCGAEVTTGMFKGTVEYFDIADASLPCCPNCHKTVSEEISESQDRISAKIKNLRNSSNIRLSNADIAALIKKYQEEEKQYAEKTEYEKPKLFGEFYCYNENGHFTVREFAQYGSLDSATKVSMALDKKLSLYCNSFLFTKDDITKIEYRFTSWHGDSAGLFSEAHSIEIRLNDEKKFTYKPCITRMSVIGKGLMPNFAKKNAEKQVIEALKKFKAIIGSDLPIVKVKKFR